MTSSLTDGALAWAADLTLALLLLALVLATWRLVRGPHVADRLVALDLMAVLGAGLIVLEAMREGSPLLLRPALIVGLVGFLGTIAFSAALQRTAEVAVRDDPGPSGARSGQGDRP